MLTASSSRRANCHWNQRRQKGNLNSSLIDQPQRRTPRVELELARRVNKPAPNAHGLWERRSEQPTSLERIAPRHWSACPSFPSTVASFLHETSCHGSSMQHISTSAAASEAASLPIHIPIRLRALLTSHKEPAHA